MTEPSMPSRERSAYKAWCAFNNMTEQDDKYLRELTCPPWMGPSWLRAIDALLAERTPQPVRMFPVQRFGVIPWEVGQRAYEKYASMYGTDQSLERLAERGGFDVPEMDQYYPAWRNHIGELAKLRARVDELERGAAPQPVPQDCTEAAENVIREHVPRGALMDQDWLDLKDGITALLAQRDAERERAVRAECAAAIVRLADACHEAEQTIQDYIDLTKDTRGHSVMVACNAARLGAAALSTDPKG